MCGKKLLSKHQISTRSLKFSLFCVFCFQLLFVAAMFGMTILGFVVTGVIKSDKLDKGDPMLLTNGIDYDGRICGASSGVKSRKNTYYMATGAGTDAFFSCEH